MHFMSSVRMDRKRFSLIVVFFSLPFLIGSGSETLGQTPAPEIEWQKVFGGGRSDWAGSVQETTDGGYIVAGGTGSFGASNNVYLVKTDTESRTEPQRDVVPVKWSRSAG